MVDWHALKQTPLGAALVLAVPCALAAAVFPMLVAMTSSAAVSWFWFPPNLVNVFFTLCALICWGAQIGTLYWVWLGIGDFHAALERRR